MSRVMIVDRDARYAEWLRHHLSTVYDESTLRVLGWVEFEHMSPDLTFDHVDLIVLTAKFGEHPDDPNSEGLVLLRVFRGRANFPAVLAIAEDGNELTAVRALQLGAVDYLPKKLMNPERLKTSVRLALRRIERRITRRHAKQAQTGDHAHSENTAEAVQGEQAEAEADDQGPAPEDITPNLIPGFTIRSIIGQSEKAVVYLASSDALARDIALKVSIDLGDKEQHQLLAREFDAIASIHHPAIVELHDYGMHEGREYIAMEYFPRGDLKARMYRGVTESEALRLVDHIACALRVVHHAGLLHRDLKPPNVMIRENDDVALIDFGLARTLEGSLQLTRTGILRGSPYYMSPEQALGEKLDGRTDLYSLGIIFYEMLTGKKPFSGGSAIEVLHQHVNAPIPKLPERCAQYQSLLNRLLAKARDDRYASAEEVIEAVAIVRTLMRGSAQQPTAA